MATLFEALPRFAIAQSPATSADVVARVSRSVAAVYTKLNGTPRYEAPRPFGAEPLIPTSALWILHAR